MFFVSFVFGDWGLLVVVGTRCGIGVDRDVKMEDQGWELGLDFGSPSEQSLKVKECEMGETRRLKGNQ